MSGLGPVKPARCAAPYVSCMKINGIPLLPPILDTDCRREMQYYKLLALEVEKQIKLLRPLAAEKTSNTVCVAEEDDPDLEVCSEINDDNSFEDFTTYITTDKALEDISSSLTAGYQMTKLEYTNAITSKYNKVVELEVENSRKFINNKKCKTPNKLQDLEIPERDHNCSPRSLRDKKSPRNPTDPNKDNAIYFPESNHVKDLFQDEPTSFSSKTFTGSLNNINYEVSKDTSSDKKLTRQSSYTLLQPSPQLLAHLTTQSMNTGLEMSAISMSDNEPKSQSISPNTKRRKSWDLETAKVQWSSMALELEGKSSTAINKKPKISPYQITQNRKKSQSRTHIKTGQQKSEKNKENVYNSISSHTIILDKDNKTKLNTPNKHKSKSVSPNRLHGNPNLTITDDPSIKVRELYDKVQKQQMQQMSALIEKQKQEQMLLQQLFEDQNNLLYRQLKNICPASPIEAKQAWTDKSDTSSDRGPVSLSQLMEDKSPPTINNTLTDTSNYISHCDQVLKKSKTITGELKKSNTPKSESNRSKTPLKLEGSRTRNTSPVDSKKAQKKLVYENSEKDTGALTDRTNDTLADINDSFPSEESMRVHSRNNNNTVINTKEKDEFSSKADDAIKNMMEDLQKSLRENKRKRSMLENRLPTGEELAASSKIVAYAKGYLVRRLMRTERVQFTVQMIKDALLCALQLHQDRQGIRGADVDLHRRLIQQITAACYNLHETFITSSPRERCQMIEADRARRHALAMRQTPPPRSRNSDLMSQSYSGSFPARAKRSSLPVNMTRSNHEAFSDYKSLPRRRPWR